MRTEEIPHLILHVNSLTEIISTNIKDNKITSSSCWIWSPTQAEKGRHLWGAAAQNSPTTAPWQPRKADSSPALPSCVQRCTSVWKATEFWKQRSNSRASQNHVNHVSSPGFSKRGSSVTLSCTVCLHTMTFGPDVDIWKALFLSG